MAKIGEADQRWIVEDRKDGTNVHNWHWAEKDVLDWAKRRLTELLGSIEVISSQEASIRTSEVQSVTGEAFVNNRKNKLIPSYELEVKGTWTGTIDNKGESQDVEGRFQFPYIGDENADEDPELKIITTTEGAAQKLAKQAIGSNKEALLAPVRTFVKEMRKGGPVLKESDSKQSEPSTSAPSGQQQAKTDEATRAVKPKQQQSKQKEDTGNTRSLQLTERFYARPKDLYECFTDVRRVQAFTQSPAKVENREGGSFEIFGGSVEGKFTQLQKPTHIAIDWRFRNWEDAAVSKVLLTFEEPQEGTTVVKLKQTRIPDVDRFGNSDVLDNTRNGWQQQIFHKIRAVFGFGL